MKKHPGIDPVNTTLSGEKYCMYVVMVSFLLLGLRDTAKNDKNDKTVLLYNVLYKLFLNHLVYYMPIIYSADNSYGTLSSWFLI